MQIISSEYKKRLNQFIIDNDLDYDYVETVLHEQLISYDKQCFRLYEYNNEFVLVKYNPLVDHTAPGAQTHNYLSFKTFTQLLEHLANYDRSLYKQYWYIAKDVSEIGNDTNSYLEDWYNDFKKNDNYKIDDSYSYNTLIFEDESYKPELKSPHNTIHMVSEMHPLQYTKVESLYFEVHPISCSPKRESYLLKLKCNNDEIFKEYINYVVTSKKGLRLLIETIFNTLSVYKVK